MEIINKDYAPVQFVHHCPEMVEFQNDKANVSILSPLEGWDITQPGSLSVSQYLAENTYSLLVTISTFHQFKRAAVDILEWNQKTAQSKYCYPPRHVFTLTPTEEATSSTFELKLNGMSEELKFSFILWCAETRLIEHLPQSSVSYLQVYIRAFCKYGYVGITKPKNDVPIHVAVLMHVHDRV